MTMVNRVVCKQANTGLIPIAPPRRYLLVLSNPSRSAPSADSSADRYYESRSPKTDWLPRFMKRIEDARNLKEGWNGYSAPVPSDLAVSLAINYMEMLHDYAVEPANVAPSVMGGIGFTFLSSDRECFVEIYNDGRIFCMFDEGEDLDPDIEGIPTSDNEMRELISRIVSFLGYTTRANGKETLSASGS